VKFGVALGALNPPVHEEATLEGLRRLADRVLA
jgi:hypothetical protein